MRYRLEEKYSFHPYTSTHRSTIWNEIIIINRQRDFQDSLQTDIKQILNDFPLVCYILQNQSIFYFSQSFFFSKHIKIKLNSIFYSTRKNIMSFFFRISFILYLLIHTASCFRIINMIYCCSYYSYHCFLLSL